MVPLSSAGVNLDVSTSASSTIQHMLQSDIATTVPKCSIEKSKIVRYYCDFFMQYDGHILECQDIRSKTRYTYRYK